MVETHAMLQNVSIIMDKNKCKTCQYFRRGKWHKCIDADESSQCGGYCDILLEVLKLQNSDLLWVENIYIQDTFGCIFHKPI